MYAVFTLVNNGDEFFQAGLTGINNFQATAGNEASIMDSKNDSTKDGLILSVERAIYKNMIVK